MFGVFFIRELQTRVSAKYKHTLGKSDGLSHAATILKQKQ